MLLLANASMDSGMTGAAVGLDAAGKVWVGRGWNTSRAVGVALGNGDMTGAVLVKIGCGSENIGLPGRYTLAPIRNSNKAEPINHHPADTRSRRWR